MSSEYDFLDDFFAEGIIKNSPPSSICSDTKPADSFILPNLNQDQVDKLKRDNLKLRSRIKLYNKALDQQKARLTQLLTEKLALREEQRKYADYGKKLEEANLCVEATVQLNKQLQELSKSHDKEKNEWEEKQTKMQENIRDLKKSLADCRKKEDAIKRRRRKYLKALVDLSEELIKLESFPKKYKRFFASWKKQLEDAEDGDCSFDFDDISASPEKPPVSIEFLSPKSSTPKKLAFNGPTLAMMSESEISEDEAAVSPGKTKFVLPPKKLLLNKLEISSISSPRDKLAPQENSVEKDRCKKVAALGSNPVLTGINQNYGIKINSDGVVVKGSRTSSSLPKNAEKRINAADQKSSAESDECDLVENAGSNNSSFSDVLEENGMEIEKNLMSLEETAEKEKSDRQNSSDSASLQSIMDEMIVSLNILQPFDDPKTPEGKPEEENSCQKIVRSSPVNDCELTAHVGTTEIIGNLSEEDDVDSSPMDDWGILPLFEEEISTGVTSARKQVIQEKLPVSSEPENVSDAMNSIVSTHYPNEIVSDSVDNNSSIRTSDKCCDKSDKPRLMDCESMNHKDAEVEKVANEVCELQTKSNSPCDNNEIIESCRNVEVNHPFSDLDHIPDSGFNSPESPVAEIGEFNVLFEKDHCSNSCVTETLKGSVSLRDSVLSLEDTIKHPHSSEVTATIAKEAPKILPEASARGVKSHNHIEEFKSPCSQKAKKSPEKGNSSLNQQACIKNDNQNSFSKVRRSRRFMKEADDDDDDESFASVIKTRSQSRTREVSMSPKGTRVKEIASRPKSSNVKNNKMDVSGRRKKNKKGRVSDEEVDDSSDTSFHSLEGDEVANAPETRVKNLDSHLKEGEEQSISQKEKHANISGSNKETGISCTVPVSGVEETAPNDLCYQNSQVVQTTDETSNHLEKNDGLVSPPEVERSSVSDMAENNDKMSDHGENTSTTSDDIMLSLSEDDDNDVDLQKTFGKNNLTSDGGQKCADSNMNGHLYSIASDKIDPKSASVAGSCYPQVLNLVEKDVNSGVMPESSVERNDAGKENSNSSKQGDSRMEGVKTSVNSSASISIPIFNESSIECSTPISKSSSLPKDLKQAFKLFLDAMNPRLSSIKNDAPLTSSEAYSRKAFPNRNSADSVEVMNPDKERSEDLGLLKEAEENLDSSIHYPLSAKHLSFLKNPFSSPLNFLVEENPKPKSSILVRCNYKNSSKGVSDLKSNESSMVLEEESTLVKSSNTNESCTSCRFTVCNSQAKDQEKSVKKIKRNPSSAGKRKLNFNVIKRPVVPFFFGACNLNTVFKVKFWIGGHFSMESYVDAYFSPKTSVVCFGNGDLKGLTPSKTTKSSSKPPPKFSGVKYSKRGTLASFSYVDQYLLPTKPLLSLFSKKPNFSAFIAEDCNSSPTDVHGRKISENVTDKSKMKNLSLPENPVLHESALHNESRSHANSNAAVKENTKSANEHGNVKRSENAKHPKNVVITPVKENTDSAANGHGNLDRVANTKHPKNVVISAVKENTDSAANGNRNLDRGANTKHPKNALITPVKENTDSAANGHGNLERGTNANPASNLVITCDREAVNLASKTQENAVELPVTEVEFSLFESQCDGKENEKSPEEMLKMDNGAKNGSTSSGDTSSISPSISVGDTASKEVEEEIHRCDSTPAELSSPKGMEIVRHDNSNINISPTVSNEGDEPKSSKITRKAEEFLSSGIRKHSLPQVIQRKSSVTPLNRSKSGVFTTGKVDKSDTLISSNNLASLDSSAMPTDGRLSSHVVLSKEESCLSKRKLQDIVKSNGEPLEKKVVQKAMEALNLPDDASVDIVKSINDIHPNVQSSRLAENSVKNISGDTLKEMIPNDSDISMQPESDDGELMIELAHEDDDNILIDLGFQEVDKHLSDIASSLSADALLDSEFLHGDEKHEDEALGSPTKIHKRQKLSKAEDEIDTETIHPCKNGNLPIQKNTELKDSETKTITESEVYDNPPKKRRIAHSPKGTPGNKSSVSSSLTGNDSAEGQPVSESTGLSETNSNALSGILVDNSVLILGEPEKLLTEMFGSPERNTSSNVSRKPRKQTFNNIRKGANLKYLPDPQEVYKMLFGEIEDEDGKEPEVDDFTTFKDPDNLCGDLNDSVDKLYEKTKKIRIAHAPKTSVKKENHTTPKVDNESDLPEISKPLARKSIVSSHNFNQKPKVRQSKLEKLRMQISKARGLFSRTVVDPNIPTTSSDKADQQNNKVTSKKDAEEGKSAKSAKEKIKMSKLSNNSNGDELERRDEENMNSSNVNKSKRDRVSTTEASSNEECEEPGEGKRETRKEATESKKGKRKKEKKDLSDKEHEEVTSEEEMDLKSLKSLLTRDRSVKNKTEKDRRRSNVKKSSKYLNASEHESSSELESSAKESEFISPKRGLKKKFTHENGEKSSMSEQDVVSPRKAITKKADLEKKRKLEVHNSESSKTSSLDSGSGSKSTSQSVSSNTLPKTVSPISAKVDGLRKSSFTDDSASEKDKVGKESDVLSGNGSEEGKLNSVKEGNEKGSIEGDDSSACKDGINIDKSKDYRQLKETLENMQVPPLSPLSSDELVDSFILCCDGDNDNWSPMKPSNKDKGDSSEQTESLETPRMETLETSPPGESCAPLGEPAGECEGTQPREVIKDFFSNLVQEYKGTKYCRNNRNDTSPDDKKEMKCLLGRLHRKDYKMEDMDILIKGLSDKTKSFKSKALAKYLVRILRKEDEDDVEHPYFCGAPRLSDMQLRIVSLVLALDRRSPRFKDLIDVILKGISFMLFRLGHAPEVEVVMSLARIYTVFCKSRKDLSSARTFCYDALFCLGLKAYALIFIVLSVWPEVFRKQDGSRDSEAIESSILISLLDRRVTKKGGEVKVVPVLNILKNAYKCQELMKSDILIKKLMQEMQEGKIVEGAEAATILLCKKKGWDWTHGNLLCQNLVSILEDYEKEKISVNVAVTAVKLIGYISRSCSMETAGPVKPIVDYLYEAMNKQEKYPMVLQEAIAQSLICLSRFYIHRVTHALDNWTPPTTPSEELVNKMINLARSLNKRFWERRFLQWRNKPKMPKDALVQCRPGVYYTDADVSKILENSLEESMDLEEGSGLEMECEGESEGNEGVVKNVNGLKVRGGKAGHRGGGVRYRGGWKGSKGKGIQRNARWVGMLRQESDWIKAEEKKWDEIAWVKRVSNPKAGRREAEMLKKYEEGNIFN